MTMSRRERSALVQAAYLLPLTTMALRLITFQRLYRVLTRAGRPAIVRDASSSALVVAEVARAVGGASRHVPLGGACLQRSVVLWWLLRRRGVDSQIKLGARKADGRLLAHAWVEIDGQPVEADDRDARHQYVAMAWSPANRQT